MTVNISKYGEPLAVYKGEGQLQHPNGDLCECKFEIGQFHDGNLRGLFNFVKFNRFIDSNFDPMNLVFKGVTEEGKKIQIAGPASSTDLSIGGEFVRGFQFYGDSRLEVGGYDEGKEFRIRFALTNFNFLGLDQERFERGGKIYGGLIGSVFFDLGSHIVEVRQVPNYRARINALSAQSGANITCFAYVTVIDESDMKFIEQVMNSLCSILSLSQSRIITWPYWEARTADNIVYRCHRNVITGNYGGISLVGGRDDSVLRRFVETAFPKYPELDTQYQLGNIIHRYIRGQHGPMVIRALTLVSLIEYLAGRLAAIEGQEHIMDKNEFANQQSKLEDEIFQLLCHLFPSLDRNKKKAMASKTKGFNYRSYRSKLQKLIRKFEIPISDQELGDFVEIRNRLVHYMDLRIENPKSSMFTNCDNDIAIFYAMTNFVDKILLRMLGYEGHYPCVP